MKKLHTPFLAIALSALLVSVSYGDANDDQVPSNDIIDSEVTNSPFTHSFNTVENESANADTSGDNAYIQQAVTNSDLSLDGNAFQSATGFNITNASGNSIVGSSSNVNANNSSTAFDDAITANDISSDATATATSDVGNTVITQTSTLTQSYTQN